MVLSHDDECEILFADAETGKNPINNLFGGHLLTYMPECGKSALKVERNEVHWFL